MNGVSGGPGRSTFSADVLSFPVPATASDGPPKVSPNSCRFAEG